MVVVVVVEGRGQRLERGPGCKRHPPLVGSSVRVALQPPPLSPASLAHSCPGQRSHTALPSRCLVPLPLSDLVLERMP